MSKATFIGQHACPCGCQSCQARAEPDTCRFDRPWSSGIFSGARPCFGWACRVCRDRSLQREARASSIVATQFGNPIWQPDFATHWAAHLCQLTFASQPLPGSRATRNAHASGMSGAKPSQPRHLPRMSRRQAGQALVLGLAPFSLTNPAAGSAHLAGNACGTRNPKRVGPALTGRATQRPFGRMPVRL